METPRKPVAFVVLLVLKDGRVIRCAKPMGMEVTRLFYRDLRRWLVGGRALPFCNRDGDPGHLQAAQVASIDLMLDDSLT